MYFYDALSTEAKQELLRTKKVAKQDKLTQLNAIFQQLDPHKDAQHIRILKKALLREQAYVDWLDFCLSEQ